MDIIRPIQTEKGYLEGRDCIYLDKYESDLQITKFTGEMNIIGVFVPYTLIFYHVLSMFSCELDTYYSLDTLNTFNSSFMIIEESSWLNKLPIRDDFNKNDFIHYRLYTYDDVFDIIATRYELTFK